MTDNKGEPMNVTARLFPKRAWFQRQTYSYRVGDEVIQSLPAKWHAGVDIIQTRTPHPGYPDNPMLDKVQMHVRALCGYVYTFDFYIAANVYGKANYKDEIKTEAKRCMKCDRELAKAPEERLMNSWVTPATRPSDTITHPNEELWWPSEK